MSLSQDDQDEEQTQHRIIGMAIIHKRIDTVVDGWESEEGHHKMEALKEIADECGVDVSACEWKDNEAVGDVPVELAIMMTGKPYSNFKPSVPCLTCKHIVTDYVAWCACLCHTTDDWASETKD